MCTRQGSGSFAARSDRGSRDQSNNVRDFRPDAVGYPERVTGRAGHAGDGNLLGKPAVAAPQELADQQCSPPIEIIEVRFAKRRASPKRSVAPDRRTATRRPRNWAKAPTMAGRRSHRHASATPAGDECAKAVAGDVQPRIVEERRQEEHRRIGGREYLPRTVGDQSNTRSRSPPRHAECRGSCTETPADLIR